MRLKLWVKIVLFIIIVGLLSIWVFQIGRKWGQQYAMKHSLEFETNQVLMSENTLEEVEEVTEEVEVSEKEPYEGLPADKVGLKPGDKILEIDGEDAEGRTTPEVSDRLRGQAGSKVKVKVEP